MPELPEVETVVRELRACCLPGRVVQSVHVDWPALTAPLAPAAFSRSLRGRRFLSIARRAKYIVMPLSGGVTLLVHLRMTGQLALASADEPPDKYQRLAIKLDDGRELRYRDTRKFGRWLLLRDANTVLGKLGPEPLSPAFTRRLFASKIQSAHRQLKPLLLDQTFLAGLGNIYTDEALWTARLHPRRRSDTLNPIEVAQLYAAIRSVLRRGIKYGGTTLGRGAGNFKHVSGRRGRHQHQLRVFGCAGRPCPRCGAAIKRIVVAQRGTYLCPECQHAADN